MGKILSKGTIKVGSLMNLKNRINYFKVAPDGMENVIQQERYVNKIKLDRKFIPLVKLYISLLNGCSYCIEMHYKEATKKKIDQNRIDCILKLNTDNKLFSEKEKTLLNFAKKVTIISENRISDTEYLDVRKYLSEKEYIDFVLLINQVNTWNRISISSGNTGKDIPTD
ncbi:carboxymuconolactone decarboxylase family protein [Jeotgalicoccus huakuii]|uniref:carboxymuconolactone decarboxylase family protein n=1 Tax=Jeotgalicoccus TaxID=227979 RepID=UPI00041CEF76|nr:MULTISPECIES: carboxymuconolactone decarboxylase family protein [Jeotgalicoccus]MCK1976810.1 carboxymuconolactone decarboxylase family protein [Jeotgalicoccus huakuii]QQD84466.1 carboxymuconolactone decarboxylase family protein [Jeotgalicoccus sp. ATCC 8456]